MKSVSRFARKWIVLAIILAGLLAALAVGQNPGNNAVYNSSNGVTFSVSFIDASKFVGNGINQSSNICGVIYGILSGTFYNYPAAGAVVDARGISGASALTCPPGTTPWNNGTNTVTAPSTILLPATTAAAPIVISSKWVLPSYTHLIGQGDAITPNGPLGTTIQVSGTFPASSAMIQFGSSSGCCTAISVENLTLDGAAATGVSGIVNQYAGDLSYVDHVGLYRILGTGLSVFGSANKSGPYSNITFDLGGNSGTNSTTCASIKGLTGTRGIHGLTCISENNVPPAAVLLDSSNNSIEDVRIVGFYDGIRVGANATAQSNVLVNIIGDTIPQLGSNTPIIVVHITKLGYAVSDLSIMGDSITEIPDLKPRPHLRPLSS